MNENDDQNNQEELVLIHEVSMEGKSLIFKTNRKERLRCYTKDLEVNFGFGKSFSEWFDHREDLTETLRVDLTNCELYIEPTIEYSETISNYNAHLNNIVKMNKQEGNCKSQTVSDLILDKKIKRVVLNKNDPVILIGKYDTNTDPVGVFKCDVLISPNSKALYKHRNRELMTSFCWAAMTWAIGMLL